ncbi:hypothetical protein BaRGS_00037052 [Batillaria attramentaria]|uniref:Uncharacterized protein n=1 Tax=Batillaria attramentaria TaxID=370345 RepID=A0ABD0JA42_9CAEN
MVLTPCFQVKEEFFSQRHGRGIMPGLHFEMIFNTQRKISPGEAFFPRGGDHFVILQVPENPGGLHLIRPFPEEWGKGSTGKGSAGAGCGGGGEGMVRRSGVLVLGKELVPKFAADLRRVPEDLCPDRAVDFRSVVREDHENFMLSPVHSCCTDITKHDQC